MPPICAVVVTYQPEEALPDNVAALRAEGAEVIMVDNGSVGPARATVEALREVPGVELILNATNRGIAAALNQGVARARARGFAWIATLDQDSRVPSGFFAAQFAALADCPEAERVAIVASRSHDPRSGKTHSAAHGVGRGSGRGSFVAFAITSGSLLAAAAMADAGPFREDLFIDGVDVEFCLRCRRRGWRILEAQDAVLDHHFGEPTSHRLLWMRPVVTNHSALRRYYSMRNRIELYREYGCFDPAWLRRDAKEALREAVKLVWFERDRPAKLAAILAGLRDGLDGRLGARRG